MPSYSKIHQWVPLSAALHPIESQGAFFIRDFVERDSTTSFLNGQSIEALLKEKARPIRAEVSDRLVSDQLLSWLPEDLRSVAVHDLMTHMHQTGPAKYALGGVNYPLFLYSADQPLTCKCTHWNNWRVNDTKDGIEVISFVMVYKIYDDQHVFTLSFPDGRPLLAGMVKATLKFDLKEQKWHQTDLDAVVHCHNKEVEEMLESYTHPDSRETISSFTPLKNEGARKLAQQLLHEERMSALNALHDDEIETLFQKIFHEVKSYQDYVEKKCEREWKKQGGSEPLPTLYREKKKCLDDIVSNVGFKTLKSKEKLNIIAEALYQHRDLLSEHQSFNEKSIWGRIKSLLIRWGLWRSQGEKVLSRIEKSVDRVTQVSGKKHRLFGKSQAESDQKPKHPERDRSEHNEGPPTPGRRR